MFPNDYTDGDRTAPKLDGVTKHSQQDGGEITPTRYSRLSFQQNIVTEDKVERELTWISYQSGVSERDAQVLPPLPLVSWSDVHSQTGFSDYVCLRVDRPKRTH